MKISKNLLVCALLVLVMLCVVSTASATDAADLNLTASDTEGGRLRMMFLRTFLKVLKMKRN